MSETRTRPAYLLRVGDGASLDSLKAIGSTSRWLAALAAVEVPLAPTVVIHPDAVQQALGAGAWPLALSDDLRENLAGFKSSLVAVEAGHSISLNSIGMHPELLPALENQHPVSLVLPRYAAFLMRYGSTVWPGIFDGLRKKAGFKDIGRSSGAAKFSETPWRQRITALENTLESGGKEIAEGCEKQILQILGALLEQGLMTPAIEIVISAQPLGEGRGVLHTRDPYDGSAVPTGSYRCHGSGRLRPFSAAADSARHPELPAAVLDKLCAMVDRAPVLQEDVYEIPFIVEDNGILVERPRRAERLPRAAVGVTLSLVAEGRLKPAKAVRRLRAEDLAHILVPTLDRRTRAALTEIPADAVSVCCGAAVGRVLFSAEALEHNTEPAILLTEDFLPGRIHSFQHLRGIVTTTGGVSSHAAILARMKGIPCAVALKDAHPAKGRCILGKTVLREGEPISMEVGAGLKLFQGAGTVVPFKPDEGWAPRLQALIEWVLSRRKLPLGVRANADTAEDARIALALGAEGVGLCRTEHLCLRGDGLKLLQKALLAASPATRKRSLRHLTELHTTAFVELFRVMEGRPVTVRLLDAPLHEFLPPGRRTEEANPMLGFRGCRMGLVHTDIYDMQISSVLAAVQRLKQQGVSALPEILVPMVMNEAEFRAVRARIRELEREAGTDPVPVGAMIEVPSAALATDRIALAADFISFGSNDLTQMTYGLSRDDACAFLGHYLDKGLIPADPFLELADCVRDLMQRSMSLGRLARPDLKAGLCGEHAGTEAGVRFSIDAGLDYVSCAPPRVLATKLLLAQALPPPEKDHELP